jgi:hypothetical protein
MLGPLVRGEALAASSFLSTGFPRWRRWVGVNSFSFPIISGVTQPVV